MSDEQERETDAPEEEARSTTSPPGGKTHEATTPPGQGDLDERAAQEAEDKLDKAAGGH